MKRFVLLLVPVLLATSSLQAAGNARENQRLAEGKITKNEAQHLVLKKYPRATIKDCVLTKGKESGIWVVTFSKAGSTDTTVVHVDGKTGQLSPAGK